MFTQSIRPETWSPIGRKRSSAQPIEPAMRKRPARPARCGRRPALAAPDARLPEVLDGSWMVRQPRLALAGVFFVEAREVGMALDQRLLVFAQGLHELVDDVVLDVRADCDDHI